MLEIIYASLLIVCVSAYPRLTLKNGHAGLQLGNTLRELYDIVRSPEVQGSLDDPDRFAEAFLSKSSSVAPGNSCECCGYNCGCCLHLDFEKIGINNTGCANVSYLPAPTYGVSATVSIDGKVYINKTVSVRNPPPICADFPYLKDIASICLTFYDINYSNSTLSACLKLEAKLAYVTIEDIDIGCFKIPPGGAVKGRQPCNGNRPAHKGGQPIYPAIQEQYDIVRSPEVQGSLDDPEAFLSKSSSVAPKNSCECCGYNCGCCLHLDIKFIGIDSVGCVNVSYLPAPRYGVSATFSIDGKVYIDETVSVKDPPPICIDIPKLKKLASICLRFYDITYTKSTFSACLKLEAKLAFVTIEDINIGCFKIPPGGTAQERQLCNGNRPAHKGGQPGYLAIQGDKTLRYRPKARKQGSK